MAFVIPYFEYAMWAMVAVLTDSTSGPTVLVLHLAILMFGAFPAFAFVTSAVRARRVAGPIGLGIYIVMSIAAGQLFQAPQVAVLSVIGGVVALAIVIAFR